MSSNAEDRKEEEVDPHKNRPKDDKWGIKQQKLKHYQPIPTLKCVYLCFGCLGLFFLLFGVIALMMSESVIDAEVRYDNEKDCTIGSSCTVTLTIDEKMDGPVYFYYMLDNFYQNHQKFMKSVDYEQLRGEEQAKSEITKCDPIFDNDDGGYTKSWDNQDLKSGDVANPCGLFASAFFRDTYALADSDGNSVTLDEDNIAWEVDREYRFKRSDDSKKVQWQDPEDEHFMVWMRPATFTKFLKLWAKIDDGLDKGDYSVTIYNQFDVSSWDGKKYVYVSTVNSFGGKNSFLGIVYIVFGVLSWLMLLVFFIKSKSYVEKPYTELSF